MTFTPQSATLPTNSAIFLAVMMAGLAFVGWSSAAPVTLNTADALGVSSFNAAGGWSSGSAPSAGNDYFVPIVRLRTPVSGSSFTFGGDSLTIAGPNGLMTYKGTGSAGVITVNNLILNGGSLDQLSGSADVFRLAGNLNVQGSSIIHAKQGPIVISAVISGNGTITNPGSDSAPNILSIMGPANTFTGNIVNSGRFQLLAGANLNFVIGASNVNNRVSGSGALTAFDGQFVFNLSAASTNLGDKWTIANAAGQTFGSTFAVTGFQRQGFGTGPGVWSLDTNGTYYEFNTASGVLSVLAAPSVGTSPSLPATSVKFEAVEADLLAAYDQTYASGLGGEANAQVIIANTVAGQNYINDRSGSGARMRIVGYHQGATYNYQSSTLGGYVGWLANNNARVSDVVAAGSASGADLVVYICEPVSTETAAGVAQQPGMYSSLAPSAVWSAVFAHETGGHNYGRSHSDGLLSPKSVMLHNYCGGGAAPPYLFTNPKIWFNGTQFQGDGDNCGQGGLINGGDNSLPSADSAVSVADRRARVLSAPNLGNVVLRWLFTNAPAAVTPGTTNLDLVSGAPAVVRGTGANYTGNALRIPGGTTGNVPMDSMSAYVDLPNGILSAQTNITIEIWATPLSAPSWARIMDFGRTMEAGNGAPGEWTGLPGAPAPGSTTSLDNIVLSAASATSINSQRFQAKVAGVATTLDAGLATTAGVPHHYAITFVDGAGAFGAAGGRWQWYRDGDPIAYLDVNNHLAQIQDVNNWLGRSQWTGDANANNDYAEVRISSVALSRGEVVAHYLLGPNYQADTTVALTASDAFGVSSFNAAGQWNSGVAPNAANSYETFDFWLRTPATASSYTFGGNTLKLSGGSLLYKSTGSSTIIVTNLQLNGGVVHHSGSGTMTLVGSIAVTTNGAQFNAQNGPINVTAPISGLAPVSFIGNNPVTLSGNNSNFSGKVLIGNGWFGSVAIDSPARLGPVPSAFTSDHLAFNRGTLTTTATMTLSNDNRGILLGGSGGTFNVAAGTTLTLDSVLSSPATAANIVVGGLTKTGAGTLVLSTTNATFKGGVWLDSGSTSANDGVVRLVNNQALASARAPFFFRNNSGGGAGATLQLDGAAGNLTVSQGLSLAGRNSSIPAVQNVAGTNIISGGITLNAGGANYLLQSDANSQLNLGGPLSAAATGSRTFTFQGNGEHNVTGVIANGSATVNVSKTGSGRLTLGGANSYSGTTTVSGGTLLVNGSTGAGALTVASGATLGGNGTIGGAVTVQPGGNLAPGTSIGTLTLDAAPTLSGTVLMELNRTNAQTSDRLILNSGTLAFGGVLTVTNSGPALQLGDSFNLFSAGGFTDSFTATNLPPLAAGQAWNFDGASGVLRVVVPGPGGPAVLTNRFSGNTLSLSWPAGENWRLQMQTNLLSIGLNTNWAEVPGSSGTNQMSIPINLNDPSVFFRLIYP